MGLFTPPTPLTPAQILYGQVITGSANYFQALAAFLTQKFNLIWSNSDQTNLSPDKAWAALGTDAVGIRMAFGVVVTALNTIQAGVLPLAEPSDWTLTQHDDGSITAVKNS